MTTGNPARGTRPRGRPRRGVREAVIAAAQQILTDRGVARLSTKEIATRAGVAESSIFYHFGDRTGLLHAVIREHLRPLQEMLTDPTGGETCDLRTDLIRLVTVLEEFFGAAIPVIAAIESDADLRVTYSQRSRELNLGPHRALDTVIAHLSARHTLVPEPRTAALFVSGAAYQRALQHRMSPPHAHATLPTPEAIADLALPLFLPEQ
ncbi:TetR/AcrR family transcriptional regulator [Nocardia vermiculata]|uniref:TetR/AcrR family transcriptional regulator n=1 Tax=Nocardia vermiculata TaxID=257274 RepID=A0A846Y220_9NOCA|nr:TetR/AcrR family transcriptional regulator [Nocardia vermiculata]NKY51751.1 TetR/AcrR family transcriptional regulator [Nocardia vermiculata]